jgi:hypothetical protein
MWRGAVTLAVISGLALAVMPALAARQDETIEAYDWSTAVT